MSFNVDWDIEQYRDDHESDEHWNLRKGFMDRWKNNYPEERLVCLARVFANIELMGCRYPIEVMQEVANLSREVAQSYRKSRKNKLQRTFVSASDAAEDRARGVKREGGIVIEAPSRKSAKISFVPQGHTDLNTDTSFEENNDKETKKSIDLTVSDEELQDLSMGNDKQDNLNTPVDDTFASVDEAYLDGMLSMKCLNVRSFTENMFQTDFGRLVLLIRPWTKKFCNITSSCQLCKASIKSTYENRMFSLYINERLVAQATGDSKQEARSIVEIMAWNTLRTSVVSVYVKERWSAQGDERISANQVKGGDDTFGTKIETSVATKMMKMMGWKGGGLGADAQGIEEPIKPNLQMVNRAGLGSSPNVHQLRQAAHALMTRYIRSDNLDVELVFSSEFSKEERALLHQCAKRAGLASHSYGDKERFLVVKKKLDPFSIARAVIQKGGNTPKYQVFIPKALSRNGR